MARHGGTYEMNGAKDGGCRAAKSCRVQGGTLQETSVRAAREKFSAKGAITGWQIVVPHFGLFIRVTVPRPEPSKQSARFAFADGVTEGVSL